MMFRYLGHATGRKSRPVLYVVSKANYIYIGITEGHPVVRWGAHLADHGTFQERLKEEDRRCLVRDEDVSFWAFECSFLMENVGAVQIGDALRLTEYYMHSMVRAKINTIRKKVGRDVVLISSVKSTTPRYYQNQACEQLAEKIMAEFLQQFAKESTTR